MGIGCDRKHPVLHVLLHPSQLSNTHCPGYAAKTHTNMRPAFNSSMKTKHVGLSPARSEASWPSSAGLSTKSRKGRNHATKKPKKLQFPFFFFFLRQKLLSKAYSLIEFLSVITRSVFLRKIRERIKLLSLLHCKSNTQGFLLGASSGRRGLHLPAGRERRLLWSC